MHRIISIIALILAIAIPARAYTGCQEPVFFTKIVTDGGDIGIVGTVENPSNGIWHISIKYVGTDKNGDAIEGSDLYLFADLLPKRKTKVSGWLRGAGLARHIHGFIPVIDNSWCR